MKSNKLKYFLIAIVLYLVSAAASYAFFSYGRGEVGVKKVETPSVIDSGAGFVIDPNAPKTEACPLNGEMRTKMEREWWEKHRPLGIMIENHQEARPQSGLAAADIIFEAVAEGGITRFLAIYYCQDVKLVGPVRSARTYFLDFISGYGAKPLYAHVGGANTVGPANALGQIRDYGWSGENDLNQFSIGFPTFWRDEERLPGVATEHTMYSATSKLWKMAKERGFTNVDGKKRRWDDSFEPWKFKKDVKKSERPESFVAKYNFWSGYGAYLVKWVYSPEGNVYKRVNGGKPHKDKNSGEQLAAKNVIIVFMSEQHANDGYEDNVHLLYGTTGSGKAMVLLDGKKIDGTWQKVKRTSRMKFFDMQGSEIELNRGQTWIGVLPVGTKVDITK